MKWKVYSLTNCVLNKFYLVHIFSTIYLSCIIYELSYKNKIYLVALFKSLSNDGDFPYKKKQKQKSLNANFDMRITKLKEKGK